MRLAIVGASGRTGQQVIKQALTRGHSVMAVVRGSSMNEERGLRLVIANPCKAQELMPAFSGQDAVISCLGQQPGGDLWIVRNAAIATLQAMEQSGVKRLLIVSGALLYPSLNPLVLLLKQTMAVRLNDGRAAEDAVITSNANWTIVRPPRLLEGNGGEGYGIETAARPKLTRDLHYSDLAACLLDLTEAESYVRQIVGVASL